MKCHCPVVSVQAGRKKDKYVPLSLLPTGVLDGGAHRRWWRLWMGLDVIKVIPPREVEVRAMHVGGENEPTQ